MRTPIGLCAREDAAAEIENFQRQPHPVFKTAAVLIVALIDDRREELTDQITVGEMQLDDVDIDFAGPAHGIAPIEFDPLYVLKIHDRGGCVEIVIVKRRRNRNPTAFLDRNRFADHERWIDRRLAPGVRQLDAELGGAIVAIEFEDTRQSFLMRVRVKPEAERRNPSLRLDRGRLGDGEAQIGKRVGAQMGDVPVA